MRAVSLGLWLFLWSTCGTLSIAAPAATVVSKAYISGMTWQKQTRNNCGPQALSSILSYWGHHISQRKLQQLKPCPTCYMASDVIDPYVQSLGMRAQRLKQGHLDHIRDLVANGIPVLVLQYLDSRKTIPHFRVINGFDDDRGVFWVNDPYYAAQATLSYPDFEVLWDDLYNREFIAIYPRSWAPLVSQVLGVQVAK